MSANEERSKVRRSPAPRGVPGPEPRGVGQLPRVLPPTGAGRRGQEAPRTRPRSSYLPGLLAAAVVVTLAVIFWPDFRALAWGWQLAIGLLAAVVVLRILVTGFDLDRSEVTLADALCGRGQYEKALEELKRVIANHPTNAEAFYLKGQCLDHLGRGSEAMEAWKQALEHNPKHGRSAHNLACEYLNQRRYLEAAEYFAVAREGGAWGEGPSIFEQNVENTKKALIHVGRQAEARGDHREVLRYADALVKLVPDYALAYAWRAQHHTQLGDYRAAIEDARQCLRIDPKYDKARMILETAEEALNAEIAASQLDSRPPRQDLSPHPASPTAPTLPKQAGEPARSSSEDRPTLWNVGDIAFGRWEIRRIIHRGGMGTIFAAWDSQSESPVALKTIRLESEAESDAGRTAFQHEAEHWFRLGHHPRIVRLFSVEKLDFRHLVLVMEYVAGQPDVGPTLYDHLRAKESLPPEEACRIALGICEAMQFAYEQRKLVHRDLKPQNVFITALGEVKVGDFGLAIAAGQRPDRPAGTLAYAAPEQWDPEAITKPTLDVYSLGVMLFEMICGRRPFELPERYAQAMEDLKVAEWQRLHREQPPPSPRALCGSLTPNLETLILQCLAKRADDRPMDYAQLAAALRPHSAAPDAPEHASIDSALPGNPGFAAYDRGLSLSSLGRLEEALACYGEAVQHEPMRSKRSEAWANKAKVLGELHRFRESVAAAQRALEIDPRDPHAQHCLAMSLSALGSHAEALAAFDRLIVQDPRNCNAYVGKGSLLLDMRDVEAATAAYEQALAMKPDHQYAANGLGLCAEARGDFEAALQCFDRAIGIHQEFAEAHNNQSRMLSRLGRETEALESARKAVQYEPQNAVLQLNLGISLHNLRRFVEARKPLEEAIRLNPNNAMAHLVLARDCGEMKLYAQAIEHGQKAAQLGEPRGAEIAELARQCLAGSRTPGARAEGPVTTMRNARPTAPQSRQHPGREPKALLSSTPGRTARRASSVGGLHGRGGVACPCGFDNPPGNAFCGQCGQRLESAASLKCRHCGGDVPTTATFCVHCGKKLG